MSTISASPDGRYQLLVAGVTVCGWGASLESQTVTRSPRPFRAASASATFEVHHHRSSRSYNPDTVVR
jgi:hypothetical protein